MKEENPPVLGSWKNWYLLLIVVLIVVIVFLYLLTNYFK